MAEECHAPLTPRVDRSISPCVGAPPAAISAASARVALEEGEITMEQVSRLYGRGKKSGLW